MKKRTKRYLSKVAKLHRRYGDVIGSELQLANDKKRKEKVYSFVHVHFDEDDVIYNYSDL